MARAAAVAPSRRKKEYFQPHLHHIDQLKVQNRTKMVIPRWVDAAEGEEVSSVSSDEEEEDQIEIERQVLNSLQGDIIEPDPPSEEPYEPIAARSAPKPGKISIKIGGGGEDATCHVCGKKGHISGFVPGTGTYVDCINKPCYLCGGSGHRTSACPHRIAPELNCNAASDVATGSIVQHLIKRERQGRAAGGHSTAPNPGRWVVDAAVLKLHARRSTCLEFHPTKDNIVLSGDKHGQIAVWDVDKVFERTVYTNLNKWLTNALKFMPSTSGGGGSGGAYSDSHVATASYDGTVKIVDIEVGTQVGGTLVDANPRGWEHVVEEDKKGNWVTFLALDVMSTTGALVAGDSKGKVYFLDPRMNEPAAVVQAHKKNTKVQSVSVNPVSDCLVLTAGNDYQARLLDARCLGSSGGIFSGIGTISSTTSGSSTGNSAEIASFAHSRVINAAYFSPITGRKILTTAQDNRLRVWDNFASSLGCSPDREIVHSHTFNRHLTAFKAEWDPKDPHERLAIIGRYISESYDGTALHPIDLIDVATGATVGELVDPNLTTISPVNKAHPRRDLIVTGSSRSLYAWKPEVDEEDENEAEDVAARMAAAAAQWAASDGNTNGAGSSKGGPKTPFSLRGSANYLFFDADESAAAKKKRAAKTTAPGEGSSKSAKTTTTTTKRTTKTEEKSGKKGETKDDKHAGGGASDSE